MDPFDPRLRLRLWVAGELADEVWLDASNADVGDHFDRAGRRLLPATEAADARGELWLMELYDPARPEAEAYQRFGTDTAGMVDPRLAT